jgi:hypothetical protein
MLLKVVWARGIISLLSADSSVKGRFAGGSPFFEEVQTIFGVSTDT